MLSELFVSLVYLSGWSTCWELINTIDIERWSLQNILKYIEEDDNRTDGWTA